MALRRIGVPVLTVLGDSGHAETMRPLLEEFGPVLPLRHGFGSVVAALRAANAQGITTFSERMQEPTARLALELDLPYHLPGTVRLLTDKYAQRERLHASGMAPVRSHLLRRAGDWDEALARVGLPGVLKPARGEGSRNVFRVDDPESGRRLAESLLGGDREENALVLEEFLEGRDEAPLGDYVSVECLVLFGKVTVLAVTGKFPLLPPFREVGQFWPSHLGGSEASGVEEMAVAAVRALGVSTGITHTEIKLTADGPRIIEVNGRLGGGLADLTLRATGLNLIEVAGRIALGRPVTPTPVNPDRVYFQFSTPAPREPCRLDRPRGVAELRRIPGITGYLPLVRRGTELPGGVSTSFLDIVGGHAADHTGMVATVEEVKKTLAYEFSTTDGRRFSLSAAGLMSR
ncbi:acetyl-CoA carboxylase biotin carboxylase subunit family protein [Streptomyces sp. NPDC058401]|uniref:ATP-grasp domain-containing protein n=1 Tax=Streptomyces sp. NPDC058401 TaxID=3346480 RepID=UPI003661E640